MYQPKTGQKCSCKRGVQRDNCSNCEGTGMVIDFAAIRARTAKVYSCPNCHETISGPPNAYGMLKCVWCHTAFEVELAVKL